MMWALLPLSLGGASRFDPGALLLYPVSLRKLFLIDVLSELTSLASIFAVPALIAVGVGAGIANERPVRAVVASVCAAAFGLSLAKLFGTTINVLMRTRRGRGETLLAILGVVMACSGILLQFAMRAVAGAHSFPAALRWTPPGALVFALTQGSRADGEGVYALALLTLAAYAVLTTTLTYRVAVGALNSSGGAGKSRASLAAQRDRSSVKSGWRLPLVAPEVSTMFEKELRYAFRNAQMRTVILMPVVMTIALRFAGSSRGANAFAGLPPKVAPYVEGARSALGIFYVFAVTSGLTANLFGYDAAGMRALILAPVARRHVLAGKNLAALVIVFAASALVLVANQIIYGGVTLGAISFGALSFLFYAGAFFTVGNYFSISFPKRLRVGRRMGSSGASGLLIVPFFLVALAFPALSILCGWLTGSTAIEYVILGAFACIAVATYFLLLPQQGRKLEQRELDILEAVARRDED
jgi:predicted permease